MGYTSAPSSNANKTQSGRSRTHLRSHHSAGWQDINPASAIGPNSLAPANPAEKLIDRRRKVIAALRIAFGAFWACDAYFKWQPAFTNNVTHFLTPPVHMPNTMLTTWFTLSLQLANIFPQAFAFGLAVTETCLAICLLSGGLTNVACCLGIFLSLTGWLSINNFSGLFGQASFDPGILIVYALIFLGLLVSGSAQTWSINHSLKRTLKSTLGPRTVPLSTPNQQSYTTLHPDRRPRIL